MRTRTYFLLGFFATLLFLSFGFYVQYFQGLEPCPLCTLQRIAFGLVGISCLLGFITARYKFLRHFYSLLTLFFALIGFGLALRQTWIQLYPSADASECGVSLQYMLQVLPWHEVGMKILAGSAECSLKTWQLLSLSMAEWSALVFAGFIAFSFFLLKRSHQP